MGPCAPRADTEELWHMAREFRGSAPGESTARLAPGSRRPQPNLRDQAVLDGEVNQLGAVSMPSDSIIKNTTRTLAGRV